MASSDGYITLRAGITVPDAPYMLMFELEERQFTLSRDGDVLVVQPYERLTRDDCQRIRRWKPHLMALLSYVPPEVQ